MEELFKNFEYWYSNFAKRPGDRFQLVYLIIADIEKWVSMEGFAESLGVIKKLDQEIVDVVFKLNESIKHFNNLPKGNRTNDDFAFTEDEVDMYEMILDFDNRQNLRCLTSENRVLDWFEKAKIEARDKKIDDIIN
jgi:hypothetical protein